MHFTIPLGGTKSTRSGTCLAYPLGVYMDTKQGYPHPVPREEPMSTATYTVSGMSCTHCKATLTKVIGELDGVTEVGVDLVAGQVTVSSTAEPDDTLIAEAVDEAGYELTGRAA